MFEGYGESMFAPLCAKVPMGWVSGYLAMLVGLGMTICVQSSSITTSLTNIHC